MNLSIRNVYRSAIVPIFLAVLLSACASTPRTLESDRGVTKVAIVSMLEENTPVVHVGFTVFNNDRTVVNQQGQLNRIATDILEQHLRAARPNWIIVPTAPDEALAKKNNSGVSWSSFTGNVKEDLQRIARETGADLVFAVIDTTRENSTGRGVGIWMRATSRDSVGSALVHAHILLVLVDKNGAEITNRGGSEANVPASELGLNYDLSSLKDPQVQERASLSMRKELSTAVAGAAAAMGY